MKKLIALTAVILFGCLFISSFSATQQIQNNAEQAIVYNEKQTSDQADKKKQSYIIKSENGLLAVYKKGETTPYMQTDASVKGLPKGDILRLERGIEVDGEENLKKILEDYCS